MSADGARDEIERQLAWVESNRVWPAGEKPVVVLDYRQVRSLLGALAAAEQERDALRCKYCSLTGTAHHEAWLADPARIARQAALEQERDALRTALERVRDRFRECAGVFPEASVERVLDALDAVLGEAR